MPELPEVQTTVDGINRVSKGLIIQDVWTSYNSSYHAGKDNIKDIKYFSYFKKNVIGSSIISASRRAKNILIHLSNNHTVLVHMKMTGHMMYGKYKKLNKKDFQGELWRPKTSDPHLNDPFNRFIRLVFTFSNGNQLVLSDMRRFAKVTLIKTDDLAKSEHLRKTGPEPLEDSFDLKSFCERLSLRPNAPIKLTLMNPEIIAGIGNIYSDEILWRTGVHPLEKTKNVPQKLLSAMFKATKEILRKGIDFGGDSMSDYRNIDGKRGDFQNQHQAYQRKGLKCLKPKCGGEIIKLKIGGRSAHFCKKHQKLKNK
jgi:formamidopyrimidine-DNA glycosylase